MELLYEFLPVSIFFCAFKLKGLMVATVAAIFATLILLIVTKIKTGKYKNMQIISFFSLVILGGFALVCKKEIFIKWKPTVIYWLLAITFLITQLLGKRPLIEKINSTSINLPKKIWNTLNILWAIFFILMGILNLYVVYFFDTNTWVNFKLFGTFGLTALFIIFQLIFISKYLVKT
jgi:intracellular septation protein